MNEFNAYVVTPTQIFSIAFQVAETQAEEIARNAAKQHGGMGVAAKNPKAAREKFNNFWN